MNPLDTRRKAALILATCETVVVDDATIVSFQGGRTSHE
jgi:hypothetical protein